MKLKLITLVTISLFMLTDVNAQWQKMPADTSLHAGYYSSISFMSDSLGFLTGCSGPDAWNSVGLFKTTDQGNSWTRIKGKSGGGCDIPASFPVPNTGYSIITYGTLQKNEVFKTTDGGATWNTPDTTGHFYLGQIGFTGTVYFTDSAVGFIAKDDSLYKTANGGKSWQLVHTAHVVHSLVFTSAHDGYAAGEHVLMRTGNGGNSWSVTNTGYSLASLSFPSAASGYAVGKNGVILKTTDAGNTWQPQASGVSAAIDLHSVFCMNPNLCYAVGDSGVILNTTDGGATWLKQNSGVKARLNAVSCAGSYCFAVGDTATLLRTTGGSVGIATASPKSNRVSVFPNPFQQDATLQSAFSLKDATLVLYNMLGEAIRTVPHIWGRETTISRGGLSNGVYFIHLRQDNRLLFTDKLVVTD